MRRSRGSLKKKVDSAVAGAYIPSGRPGTGANQRPDKSAAKFFEKIKSALKFMTNANELKP